MSSIGMALIADGLTLHIPKGYIYFAMAFSVFVEMINLRIRKREPDPFASRESYNGNDGNKKVQEGQRG